MLNAVEPAGGSPGKEETLPTNYFSFASTPPSPAKAWREADTKSSGKRRIREGGQNPPSMSAGRRERGKPSDLPCCPGELGEPARSCQSTAEARAPPAPALPSSKLSLAQPGCRRHLRSQHMLQQWKPQSDIRKQVFTMVAKHWDREVSIPGDSQHPTGLGSVQSVLTSKLTLP